MEAFSGVGVIFSEQSVDDILLEAGADGNAYKG